MQQSNWLVEVTSMHTGMIEEDIMEIFKGYGTIKYFYHIYDESGLTTGTLRVCFHHISAARNAVYDLTDAFIDEIPIAIKLVEVIIKTAQQVGILEATSPRQPDSTGGAESIPIVNQATETLATTQQEPPVGFPDEVEEPDEHENLESTTLAPVTGTPAENVSSPVHTNPPAQANVISSPPANFSLQTVTKEEPTENSEKSLKPKPHPTIVPRSKALGEPEEEIIGDQNSRYEILLSSGFRTRLKKNFWVPFFDPQYEAKMAKTTNVKQGESIRAEAKKKMFDMLNDWMENLPLGKLPSTVEIEKIPEDSPFRPLWCLNSLSKRFLEKKWQYRTIAKKENGKWKLART